ncbi:hydantoinase/oxoprolinase family protein [Leucobacter chironomi]|uniref:hydantoinase/oxoprolinase family protein n=1 Tax=Leucobacter chironomi TaxID=491918 RepID=UPI0003FB0CFC|nr:hydantoinase/oxoprolinase family protein [Leucobacter chironomi]
MTFRIGVDIGGTFTDFTVIDEQGGLTLWKQDTDPVEPTRAIELGLEAVAGELGLELRELLADTALFVHGTTISTNTLIQRNGPKVGLLATEGFRDVLYLRDGFKPDRYDVHVEHPGTFVDRYLRLGVRGRIDNLGAEVVPLDEGDVRAAARIFADEGVESVAVGYLWSILNPAHEQRTREILAEELPGVPVICSADVLPEIREWERTSCAVLSAYILPGISGYLAKLEELLRTSGYGRGPLIMQINGGCASVAEILQKPVNVLASGPAAAPAAALSLMEEASNGNLITVDMGGTSLDVCLIHEGRATMSREIQVEHQPIGVPAVDVVSVGAGGGSIGWLDSGGALRVGPRSAGAKPGPAAYDMGGTEPTVTDANIALGRLSPTAFLGGRRDLRKDLAERAIDRAVAAPLGLTTIEGAAGIIRVVDANMVSAIRGVSVERGIDPRNFSLIAGGGAGGLHAVGLARELGVRTVLIPREAGTLCSYGMTVTDVRLDETVTGHSLSNADSFTDIDRLLDDLSGTVRRRLDVNGISEDRTSLEYSVDARYPGQVHELTIQFSYDPSTGVAGAIEEIARRFNDEHRQQFTYARDEMPIEFLHWRVAGIGSAPFQPGVPEASAASSVEEARVAVESAYSAVDEALVETSYYNALNLNPGMTVAGPAILQAPTTTVFIDTGDSLTVREDGGYLISVAPKA